MPDAMMFAWLAAAALGVGALYLISDRIRRPVLRVEATVIWKRHDEPAYDAGATMGHHMSTQMYDEDLYSPERYVVAVEFAGDRYVIETDEDVFVRLREHGSAIMSFRTGRWSGRVFPIAIEVRPRGTP